MGWDGDGDGGWGGVGWGVGVGGVVALSCKFLVWVVAMSRCIGFGSWGYG